MTERNAHVAEPFRTTLNAMSPLVPARTVDPDISDLFFNRDFSSCELLEDGVWVGYKDEELREEARIFLGNLSRLNVAVPTVDELLADFHARV